MRRKALTILAMGLVASAAVPAARAQVGAPGQPPAPVQIGAPGQPGAPVQVAPGRPAAPVQVGAPGQPGAPVQVAPGQPGAPGTERGQFDRDAGKRETIRGVIAGVTVMGEMTFDPATNRAQSAEASYLTIVGSPTTGQSNQPGRPGEPAPTTIPDQQGRSRHNIYALWVTQQTSIRDATSQTTTTNSANAATPTSFDRLEIGDKVEVTYIRRENANSSGGDPRNEMRLRRHGRHRTYSGDVQTVTILSEPMRQNEGTSETNAGARPNNRDDDRDKVRNNRDDEQDKPRNNDR